MASGIDDPLIPDREILYRRVSPEWVVSEGNSGQRRLSSAAFQNLSGNAFSVHRSNLTKPTTVIARHPGYGLVSFSAGEARSLSQGVTPEPTEDEPAHAHVNGDKNKKIKSAFRDIARWEIDIR